MNFYYWATLGLVLISVDVASVGGTGFLSMVVGLAMLTVSALSASGITTSFVGQMTVVVGLSALGLLALRRLLAGRKKIPEQTHLDSFIGLHCVLRQRLAPGEQGHVELRGTLWQAINQSASPLVAGSLCEVIAVEGISLGVRPLPSPSAIASSELKVNL